MKIFFILLAFLISFNVYSQEKSSGKTFVKIYYPNGKESSEGYMVDGKPDGYWKTYYVTGVLKSEGNRKSHLLDSIWIFYNEVGDTTEKINFILGKKNGYYYRFSSTEGKNSSKKSVVVARELYVNDKKEGLSYYFYPDGKLHETINFKNNKRHGYGREYDEEENVITLYEFFNDYITEKQNINRTINGLKEGYWKEFYESGKLKSEKVYKNDLLNGYTKDFDNSGKVVLILLYNRGKLLENAKNDSLGIDEQIEYDANGKIKKRGYYKLGVPIGIHREYDENEKVVNAFVYNENGKIVSKGIVNEDGTKEGNWEYFFEDGEVRSAGVYKNNRQNGEWKFYFRGGVSEQTGSFDNGQLNGSWEWFYKKGQILRIENFNQGSRDGAFLEYSEKGDTIVEGKYSMGIKSGLWRSVVGDAKEEGTFVNGLKEGIWKSYYPNGVLMYVGNFIQGNADGKHLYYYPDGKIREEQEYISGIKEKTWRKYLTDGTLLLTITYDNDLEVKINGFKIDRRRL